MDGSNLDALDVAMMRESHALSLVIAVGEQWKALHDANMKPTEEETVLHQHLVDKWRAASQALAYLLLQPR